MISRRGLIAAGPLALAACGRSDARYFGNTQPPKTQKLTLVLEGEPESIDPPLADGMLDQLVLSLFEGLTSLHPATGAPMAALATHYEVSADALRYRFYLRGHPSPLGNRLPGTGELSPEYSRGRGDANDGMPARWSDGRRVTSNDFVFAWRRALEPEMASMKTLLLYAVRNGKAVNAGKLKPDSLGIRAIDDLTLEVELEQPTRYFLELVSNRVTCAVPEHVIRVAGQHWIDPASMVCSGPFKLKSRRSYESIVIERNPLYYDAGQVALDEITFLVPRERSVIVNLYRAGEATVTEALAPAAVPILRQKKDFRAQRMYASSFIAINTAVAPFNDVRVRYALNMATNKQRVRDLFGAGNIPSRSVIPQDAGYEPARSLMVRIGEHDYDVLAFDPEAARQILSRVPKPLPSRMEYLASNNPEDTLWAQVLRDQWREHLGIDTAIVLADFPTWISAIVNGTFRHLASSGTSASYIDPIWFLEIFVDDGYGTHWKDPQYNALVADAKGTSDPELRTRKLKQCEEYLLTAMPVLPQDQWVNAIMVKPYVRGLGNNLLDREQLKYVWIDTNWRPQ